MYKIEKLKKKYFTLNWFVGFFFPFSSFITSSTCNHTSKPLRHAFIFNDIFEVVGSDVKLINYHYYFNMKFLKIIEKYFLKHPSCFSVDVWQHIYCCPKKWSCLWWEFVMFLLKVIVRDWNVLFIKERMFFFNKKFASSFHA